MNDWSAFCTNRGKVLKFKPQERLNHSASAFSRDYRPRGMPTLTRPKHGACESRCNHFMRKTELDPADRIENARSARH